MRHLAVGGVLVTLPPIFFALNLTQGKPNATFCAMRWITDNLEALTRHINIIMLNDCFPFRLHGESRTDTHSTESPNFRL